MVTWEGTLRYGSLTFGKKIENTEFAALFREVFLMADRPL
jgi:hypothetical protein